MGRGLVLAALVVLVGADAKPDAKGDLARLKGTWRWEAMVNEGQEVPAEQMKDARLIIGDNGEWSVTGAGGELGGTMTLDPSKNPKTMDVKFERGPEKGETSLGIYELTNDTWKICFGLRKANGRPTEFKSKPGSGHVYEDFKRVKP